MNRPPRYRRPVQLDQLGSRHAVVEASAGTGKTYVLEHLVVDLVLRRGASLDEILVVTFTEKATAELVERVRHKFEELAALPEDHPNAIDADEGECWVIDGEARNRLTRALQAFDRASIFTIHGFCQRVLVEYAFSNRRLFDEEQIDEDEAFSSAFAAVLRTDVAGDGQLRALVGEWKAAGHALFELRRDVAKVGTILAGLHPPRPEALCPALVDLQVVFEAVRAFADVGLPSETVTRVGRQLKIHASTVRSLGTKVAFLWEACQRVAGVDDVPRFLSEIDVQDGHKSRVEYVLENLYRLAAGSAEPGVGAAIRVCEIAPDLRAALVARLWPRVNARLEKLKREAGRFDFQDMLNLVSTALGDGAPTALLTALRSRYRYGVIDEFQDTDEVQWSIFRRLFGPSQQGDDDTGSANRVLTVIGDPKQAIYSFRGADVQAYLRAKEAIETAGGPLVFLDQNFRSSQAVITGVNAILDQSAPFFRESGGIVYDHPVRCGRPELDLFDDAGGRPPGIVVFDVETDLPRLLTWQVKRSLLGRMVAEIERLLEPESGLRFGTATKRFAVGPNDIFVLTRTIRESREVGEALRRRRIPFAYFKQERLFGTVEAAEVLDLLRAIAEPDDITARSRAFITPFFGMDLPDLAGIADLDGRDESMRRLYGWRALGEAGDFETLFARIVEESGLVCRELFFRDTERRLTNYLHLFEILQEEATHARMTVREMAHTLGAYILGARRPAGISSDVQRLETEAAAVQIMTIHHAKGLEAPVVFVYGAFWTGPHSWVRGFHGPTGERMVRVGRVSDAEKARHEDEDSDEERRVLYVALTRAQVRLYLPRFPVAFDRALQGAYRFVNTRLRELLGGFTEPEIRQVFELVSVPCPAPPPLDAQVATDAQLIAWQPPPELLSAPDGSEFARIAAARAGFMMTSYSAVKRHGGGSSDAWLSDGRPGQDEFGLGLGLGAEAEIPDHELPPGRLTGRFLHEVLEEVSFDTVLSAPDAADWGSRLEVAALVEKKRRRHDRDPAHMEHAVRLVHAALTGSIQLGEALLPNIASLKKSVREMEFVYPIPETSHPQSAVSNLELDPEKTAFPIGRGVVKGFIDLVFEFDGRVYVCDWKGDHMPSWDPTALAPLCHARYGVQAQLYTLATMRLFGLETEEAFEQRFGGIVYAFLRGMIQADGRSGIVFDRPDYAEVSRWQRAMTSNAFWGRR